MHLVKKNIHKQRISSPLLMFSLSTRLIWTTDPGIETSCVYQSAFHAMSVYLWFFYLGKKFGANESYVIRRF